MINVRNARLVWGEASTQYQTAVELAVEYFRSMGADTGTELEGLLKGLRLDEGRGGGDGRG